MTCTARAGPEDVALLARVELEVLRRCAIAGKEKLALVVYPPA